MPPVSFFDLTPRQLPAGSSRRRCAADRGHFH
jgi:hypothetical protein